MYLYEYYTLILDIGYTISLSALCQIWHTTESQHQSAGKREGEGEGGESREREREGEEERGGGGREQRERERERERGREEGREGETWCSSRNSGVIVQGASSNTSST